MIDLGEDVLQILLSLLAGAVVGWEREVRNRPAGLKTHMLVALGSTLIMMTALDFVEIREQRLNGEKTLLEMDPMRVIGGVIGGIGFLGAGAIIQGRRSVEGLTTASTIWVTAAIGIVCGLGQFVLAGLSIGAVMLVLVVVRYLKVCCLGMEEDDHAPPESWPPVPR
ncbi:MgtC/SapB family protein [Rubinisphaera sp. JC750]|uniref:MgtC/SapB family protein n=1 Tax=Rubinisphaera sp. JC750 TaxID=2898658 RepID=UPI001F23244B|nr:MgtC/SapB family protein [Rubinisphaera sp. JC750]